MSDIPESNDPPQGVYLVAFLIAFLALIVTMFASPLW
jgi:hypothetical protein